MNAPSYLIYCVISTIHIRNANGFGNWTLVMLTFLIIIVIIDNYQKYGLIKQPFEIMNLVIEAIISHWWLYVLVPLVIIQQTFQLCFVEKLLSQKILSEKLGLTLHAVNAFFSTSVCIMIARVYSLNPVVIRTIMQFVFYKIPKVWSYAYVNYVVRNQRAIEKKDDTVSTTYPKNVTITNAIIYIMFTPDIQYQPSSFHRTSPNWKGYIKKLLYIFLLYCSFTFIAIQFLQPELRDLKNKEWSLIPSITSCLRLMIFVHLLWLNAYLISYKLYHPAYADLMGMSHLKFDSDWWNSVSLMDFWRRWNFVVYNGMKNTVVKPLLSKGWNKGTVEIIAFFIAGILHEVLYTLPLGAWVGEALFATLLEMPFGKISVYISKNYGKEYGNMSMWLYLNITHTFSLLYLCSNYNIVSL